MRIPQLDLTEAAYFMRIITTSSEFSELDTLEVQEISNAVMQAEAFCAAHTGLETERESGTDDDNNADLRYAVKVKAAEMYDNRQDSAQTSAQNPVVMQILAQHSRNLLPEADSDE